MKLKAYSTMDGRTSILELAGRFDAYEVPPVREWLITTSDSAFPQIIVNLRSVNFVDSAALATLVKGMKHCRQQRGDLYICCLQPQVQTIFEMTRLDKAFSIFKEQDEAIKAFSNLVSV